MLKCVSSRKFTNWVMALAGLLSAVYLLTGARTAGPPSAPDEGVQITVAERRGGGLWDPSQKVPLVYPFWYPVRPRQKAVR